MFMPMCNSPACSHPALSTVHQRPRPNTGRAPLAPNTTMTLVLGDRAERMFPPPPIPPPDISSVTTHSVTHAPITTWVNPKSAPMRRNAGPNPHKPGFDRPHE